MSKGSVFNVFVFGIGNVGSTLIDQILEWQGTFWEQYGVRLQLSGLANSTKICCFDKSFSENWRIEFETHAVPYSSETLLQWTAGEKEDQKVVIDATAGTDFVKQYKSLVEQGYHIITANKIANTAPYDFYTSLRQAFQYHDKRFLYETNVGAGLPIIETLRSLYRSGEQIQKVRGVFSGSLSYIFNRFSQGNCLFSEALSEAVRLGYTEPDVREDLSGNDVARKLLILAREIGWDKNFEDVLVESVIPNTIGETASPEAFSCQLPELDKYYERFKSYGDQNSVIRYIGELDVEKQQLSVRLVFEDLHSAIGQLRGADSVFEIYTRSYGELPLVIRGAGAGKEVTARGLLCDLVKLCDRLTEKQAVVL